ncbi:MULTISPECIES: hypothetical protein [Actinomadura]|uniref:hypothetical protein n=1 Tax=Actinomadura TaxID=1988 RepID=UPI001BE48602|nr:MULTISPECIES: hypothetical protein [Actinomadura]MBT2211193.1 hypothetical protein [Actinomadura sp. NEAU-AAG7]
MTEDGPFTLELALSELRRDHDVQIANLEGQFALLLQRNELHEQQARAHIRHIGELDDRLTAAERDQVTHAYLDKRFRHIMTVLSLLATTASVVVALVTTLLST